MIRIEKSRIFPVDPDVGFDYITDPTNWPEFWPELVDIPDVGRARLQEPGDTMRLRMRLAGRLTELHMTLDRLSPPALVRYHTAQQGMPDAAHERHFEPAAGGFKYRLVISFMPRAGLAGLFDRTLFRYAAARCARHSTTWRGGSRILESERPHEEACGGQARLGGGTRGAARTGWRFGVRGTRDCP